MTSAAGTDYKVPDPSFYDDYEVGGQFVPPPQAKFKNERGKLQYVEFRAQLPSVDQIETGATGDGYLKFVVKDIKVFFTDANGEEREYVIGQTHVGSKQYNKKDKQGNVTGQRNSSPLGDLFRSAGIDLKTARPSTPEDYENLKNNIADRTVLITGDWSSYDSANKQTVAGKYEDYPLDGTDPLGPRQPFVEIDGKRFWARFGVKRWVPAAGLDE